MRDVFRLDQHVNLAYILLNSWSTDLRSKSPIQSSSFLTFISNYFKHNKGHIEAEGFCLSKLGYQRRQQSVLTQLVPIRRQLEQEKARTPYQGQWEACQQNIQGLACWSPDTREVPFSFNSVNRLSFIFQGWTQWNILNWIKTPLQAHTHIAGQMGFLMTAEL